MLKQLYHLLSGLIATPEKTWETLAGKRDLNNEEFYRRYLYPVVGIIALASFCGVWTGEEAFRLQTALKVVIKETLACFIGFHLATFCLFRLSGKFFDVHADLWQYGRFAGYSSATIYAVACVLALFPSLFFFYLFVLYTICIVWHGAGIYMHVSEDCRPGFTVFASVVIILSPAVVRLITTLIIPGL
jgi:hypothetical protein